MKVSEFFKWALFWCIVSFIVGYFSAGKVYAKKPDVKAKFYDFSEQLIDGEIKRPQALYTDVRQEARFKRLLRLKKNFLDRGLMQDARMPIFK